MAHSRGRPPRSAAPENPSARTPLRPADASRGQGPFEALFQEMVRRAATAGLSGFFLTESAVRNALNDAVPKEWTDYASRQSDELRQELIDRISDEFGRWLHSIDLASTVQQLLSEGEIEARIVFSARPKSPPDEPEEPQG